MEWEQGIADECAGFEDERINHAQHTPTASQPPLSRGELSASRTFLFSFRKTGHGKREIVKNAGN